MRLLLFSLISLSTHFLQAQIKHGLSIQSGAYHNDVTRFSSLDGAASFEHQNSLMLGIGYQYNINSNYSIKPQFNWQSSKLISNSIGSNGQRMQENIELKTLNIPILFSINLNRYFFIDAGPVLHFELKNSTQGYLDRQSGIGFALGAGLQYQFFPFTVFAKPSLQLLSLLPFNSFNHYERVFSKGILIGCSYGF